MNYSSLISMVAPTEVIWKHEFFFLMFTLKCLESDVYPDSDLSGSHGGNVGSSLTFPLEQHNAGGSSFHFVAPQKVQTPSSRSRLFDARGGSHEGYMQMQ
jgi:hypothetical protein